jgi:hypothetical protein
VLRVELEDYVFKTELALRASAFSCRSRSSSAASSAVVRAERRSQSGPSGTSCGRFGRRYRKQPCNLSDELPNPNHADH